MTTTTRTQADQKALAAKVASGYVAALTTRERRLLARPGEPTVGVVTTQGGALTDGTVSALPLGEMVTVLNTTPALLQKLCGAGVVTAFTLTPDKDHR